MVTVKREDYEVLAVIVNASVRKRLKQEVVETGDGTVEFGDDVAADVYEQVMEHITLREMTREYGITKRGRELELLADSIFEQSGG